MTWMIHVELAGLMIGLLGGFMLLNAKIDQQSARTDKLYEMFCTEVDVSRHRTDKLYEMFIDLVKETRGG